MSVFPSPTPKTVGPSALWGRGPGGEGPRSHPMSLAYQSEELDESTREYLRAVRVAEGRGMPGIFVRQTNYLPVTGLLLGLLIIGLTLLATLPPVGNPL